MQSKISIVAVDYHGERWGERREDRMIERCVSMQCRLEENSIVWYSDSVGLILMYSSSIDERRGKKERRKEGKKEENSVSD